MKKVIIMSLLLSVFCLSFSIIVSLAAPIKQSEQSTNSPTASPSPQASPTAEISPKAEYVYEDDSLIVMVCMGDEVVSMPMGEYLVGVVAAEMPAAFEPEALRAQAVAARTVALYHMLSSQCQAHPDADVCTDSTCCQAYADDQELQDKWGTDYTAYMAKITDAVRSTDGECLVYNSELIQAVFHSSSAALTAESGEVWSYNLPYLVSVASPESSENVPNYVSSVTVTLSDFKETVLQFYPDAVFTADTAAWVTDITHTKSGRIGSLKLGGVLVSGPTLRNIFDLRSTAASIEINDTNIVFTTTGYGHGVGMSQYGANTFALEGKSYSDILAWYYTGASISHAKDFINN